MTSKLNSVFVYGTLRPSKVATHCIHSYKMYDYGKFPYLIPSQGIEVVYGNVLKVTDEQLEQLDHYEGVDRGLYARETTTAYEERIYSDRKSIDCFVYVATDRLHPKIISSGDWYSR